MDALDPPSFSLSKTGELAQVSDSQTGATKAALGVGSDVVILKWLKGRKHLSPNNHIGQPSNTYCSHRGFHFESVICYQ